MARGPVELSVVHFCKMLKQFTVRCAVASDEAGEIAQQDVVGHTSE
jgi:hypothetical protein